MVGRSFKTSAFECTANFDFASLYLRCLGNVLKMQGMKSKLKIDELSFVLGE